MRTAERPRLEVNAQPLRELAQVIELVGERPLLCWKATPPPEAYGGLC